MDERELRKRIERGVRLRTLHLDEIMRDVDEDRRIVNAYAWAAALFADAIAEAQQQSSSPDWSAVITALSFDLYVEFFERAPSLADEVEITVSDEFVGVRP